MSLSIETQTGAGCRPSPSFVETAKCLLCPLVALCRAQQTRAALGELDERELKDIGLSHSEIEFVARATADDASRPTTIV
jgi:uncharacterized protein YjiS (DUF1127 family)